MTCREETRMKGGAYPRSCPDCQFGPCKLGHDYGRRVQVATIGHVGQNKAGLTAAIAMTQRIETQEAPAVDMIGVSREELDGYLRFNHAATVAIEQASSLLDKQGRLIDEQDAIIARQRALIERLEAQLESIGEHRR
jgi:hypothetical protein